MAHTRIPPESGPAIADATQQQEPAAPGSIHKDVSDGHMEIHAHHLALEEMHEKAGQKPFATQHRALAMHHLALAEHHHNLAATPATLGKPLDAAAGTDGAPIRAEPKKRAGGDMLAIGAASQLHKKGHIDAETRDRIHKSARRRAPFGLAGAGHMMGSVDASDSGGTAS